MSYVLLVVTTYILCLNSVLSLCVCGLVLVATCSGLSVFNYAYTAKYSTSFQESSGYDVFVSKYFYFTMLAPLYIFYL